MTKVSHPVLSQLRIAYPFEQAIFYLQTKQNHVHFPGENELYTGVIFFNPISDKVFSNGKNSPKGTRLTLLYTCKTSSL